MGVAVLYYDEYGDRKDPTLLLLHGAGALDTFCQQYHLADRYHLVVPHLPGAGRAADEIYEPESTVEELFALIEDLQKERIGVIGHSLGAQIAIILVSRRPGLFGFAVFLSAWVIPRRKTIRMYCALSGLSVKLLHWKWLVRLQGRYWGYTAEQAERMAEYSKKITPQVYRSFFTDTLDLSSLPGYRAVNIPMLAVCGKREMKDMKTSLALLSENPKCRTMILQRSGHDLPMRSPGELDPILEDLFRCVYGSGK